MEYQLLLLATKFLQCNVGRGTQAEPCGLSELRQTMEFKDTYVLRIYGMEY